MTKLSSWESIFVKCHLYIKTALCPQHSWYCEDLGENPPCWYDSMLYLLIMQNESPKRILWWAGNYWKHPAIHSDLHWPEYWIENCTCSFLHHSHELRKYALRQNAWHSLLIRGNCWQSMDTNMYQRNCKFHKLSWYEWAFNYSLCKLVKQVIKTSLSMREIGINSLFTA